VALGLVWNVGVDVARVGRRQRLRDGTAEVRDIQINVRGDSVY